MDLFHVLRTIRRWRWLLLSVVLVTGLVMSIRLVLTAPVYAAGVKLQLTPPQAEDVALYDRYRAIPLRDEMAVVRNNFTEVLQSREVRTRITKQLGLTDAGADYELKIRPIRDADFVYVTVEAHTGELAAQIANAHTAAAIAYYGEVRAKPATAAKEFLAGQLDVVDEQLRASEAAFAEFKIQNGIMSLDNELTIFQGVIQRLQEERSRRLIEGPASWEIQVTESLINQLNIERERATALGDTAAAARYNQAIANNRQQLQQLRETTSATAHIDSVIAKRRDELARLVVLEPRYNELRERAEQVRSEYNLILSKYTEAVLKENSAKSATHIQVIEPGIAPARAAPSSGLSLLVLALVASLGLGVVVVFLAEHLTKLISVHRPMTKTIALEEVYQHDPGKLNGHEPQRNRKVHRKPLKPTDRSTRPLK